MKLMNVVLIGISTVMMVSCVTSKKYDTCSKNNSHLEARVKELEDDNKKYQQQFMGDEATIRNLNDRLSVAVVDSTQKQRAVNNLSQITGIQEQNIDKQYDYINNMKTLIAHKDSFYHSLVNNLQNACGDVSGISIKTEKGLVYIDFTDKLLFNSGKYTVTEPAKRVLAKIAVVLQEQPQLKFTLEGHTDNAPFDHGGVLLDNWDLSVKRATSVIRILQHDYHIDPRRMNASGYSEYAPTATNNTKEGMAENRITRIIILPDETSELYTFLQHKHK